MKIWTQLLTNYLETTKAQHLYRKKLGPDVDFKGVNFSSNDYLSLNSDPQIKKIFSRGFKLYSSGSGGSMVVSGYHSIHQELERAFAEALNTEDALLFTSGYQANLAIILFLANFVEHFFIDKTIHASFYDGLKLTSSIFTRFFNHNLDQLENKIDKTLLQTKKIALLTESIFSMGGVCADLPELTKISEKYALPLIVDEAHAFGVWGPQGLGLVAEHEHLQASVIPLRIIPFGKAFAHQGAIIVGKKIWIESLLQFARPLIYSTAVSPALAYGLLETFNLIRQADEKRNKLYQLINYFRQAVNNSPLIWSSSTTQIQQLYLGSPELALQCTSFLREKGIFCQALRRPTVDKKSTGLRVSLNSQHTFTDIDYLFKELHYFYELIH